MAPSSPRCGGGGGYYGLLGWWRVEKVKGEGWLDFCDRRSDWGRDLALGLGRKHCGLTLRELEAAVPGMAYPAVSKATQRMGERLQRDRPLRALAQKAETIMSYVQT